MEVARKYGDRVLEPVEGIGAARVKGTLEASSPYIVCADSDSVYEANYCTYAAESLRLVNAVRAGLVLPLELTEPLSALESAFHFIFPVGPCEFAIAFRKDAFLKARIHEEDYSFPLKDVGAYVWSRLGLWPNYRMTVWSRLPTRLGRDTARNYLPSALAGAMPVLGVAGISVAQELLKGR
jgi:hypothetical protein